MSIDSLDDLSTLRWLLEHVVARPMGRGAEKREHRRLRHDDGIAKQLNGWVEAQSELGKGTTFEVFLPAHPN